MDTGFQWQQMPYTIRMWRGRASCCGRPSTPEESRVGRVLILRDSCIASGVINRPTCAVGLAMLVAVMVVCAGSMRGSRNLRFTDSVAAMMALVDGKSD